MKYIINPFVGLIVKLIGNHAKRQTDEWRIYRQTSEVLSIVNSFLQIRDKNTYNQTIKLIINKTVRQIYGKAGKRSDIYF